jgi:hypothetical protein
MEQSPWAKRWWWWWWWSSSSCTLESRHSSNYYASLRFISIRTCREPVEFTSQFAYYLSMIQLNIINPRTRKFALWTLFSFSPTKFCTKPSSPWYLPELPTCSIHLIYFMKCQLCTSSLCNFLHPPVTFSLFGINILLGTAYWNTLILHIYFPWSKETKKTSFTTTRRL